MHTHDPNAWDSRFTLVAIYGRWVYDYGHVRGWNEIHAVKWISKITDAEAEKLRAASGAPPLRPRTDEELRARIRLHCEGITDPPAPSVVHSEVVALHPSLAYSHATVRRPGR